MAAAGGGWQGLFAGKIAYKIATIHKRVELVDRVLLWHVEVVDGLVSPSDVAGSAAGGRAQTQASSKSDCY